MANGRRYSTGFWDAKVVAYRLIRILWGERLCYIIIKAEGKVVLVCVQQAVGDVSH